jgi:hypothetical protein
MRGKTFVGFCRRLLIEAPPNVGSRGLKRNTSALIGPFRLLTQLRHWVAGFHGIEVFVLEIPVEARGRNGSRLPLIQPPADPILKEIAS